MARWSPPSNAVPAALLVTRNKNLHAGRYHFLGAGKRDAARLDNRWTMSAGPRTHVLAAVAELSCPPRILEVKIDDLGHRHLGCRIAVGLTVTSTKQTKGCDIARSYAKQLSALLGVPVFAPCSPAFRWIVLGLCSDCRVQLATESSSRPANRHTGEARIEIDSTALTVENVVSDSNCMVQ